MISWRQTIGWGYNNRSRRRHGWRCNSRLTSWHRRNPNGSMPRNRCQRRSHNRRSNPCLRRSWAARRSAPSEHLLQAIVKSLRFGFFGSLWRALVSHINEGGDEVGCPRGWWYNSAQQAQIDLQPTRGNALLPLPTRRTYRHRPLSSHNNSGPPTPIGLYVENPKFWS